MVVIDIFFKYLGYFSTAMLEFLQNDTLRLMIALSIQAPLSYPIRSIKSYRARYLYSLIIGTLLQILVFRHHAVVVLLFGIAIFQLINIKGTYSSGSLVTILSMVVLSSITCMT